MFTDFILIRQAHVTQGNREKQSKCYSLLGTQ